MTRAFAKALAPAITVNAVAPGIIPFEESSNERIQKMIKATPAGRAVLYFLTAGDFVTGQTLQVDGGMGLG
jgi:NAD(P)-dependent dehydrogenase (short-subunit alcohol dehydrogenase family)